MKSIRTRFFLPVILVAGLISCPGTLLCQETFQVSPVQPKAAPFKDLQQPSPKPKPGAVRPPDASVYRLLPGDTIDMKVYQEEELDTQVRIGEDGKAGFPLIGRVVLRGLSTEEAAARIRETYMIDYLVDPLVSVSIFKFGDSRFTILGQVKQPGLYKYPSNQKIDVLQAIAMAGGLTRIGSHKKITVKRTVAGKEQVTRLNVKDMADKQSKQIFAIQTGDVISVGESFF